MLWRRRSKVTTSTESLSPTCQSSLTFSPSLLMSTSLKLMETGCCQYSMSPHLVRFMASLYGEIIWFSLSSFFFSPLLYKARIVGGLCDGTSGTLSPPDLDLNIEWKINNKQLLDFLDIHTLDEGASGQYQIQVSTEMPMQQCSIEFIIFRSR